MFDMKSLTLLMFWVAVNGYSIEEETEDCKNGQQEASYYDDRQYFRCIHGVWVTLFCDEGWTYNEEYRSCQVAPPSFPTTPLPTPPKHEASCDPPDDCPPGAYFPDMCNCRKYYQCDHGGAVLRDCGPGTAFNPKYNVCDWPYNVKLCKILGQL